MGQCTTDAPSASTTWVNTYLIVEKYCNYLDYSAVEHSTVHSLNSAAAAVMDEGRGMEDEAGGGWMEDGG